MGDFRAQIAAVKTGERRFLELIRKYGRDAVLGGIAAIMDQSETVARARVARHAGRRLRGRVVHGRRRHQRRPARADPRAGHDRGRPHDGRPHRRRRSRCRASTIPAITAGRSCCQVAFKCLTSALDLPINDGAVPRARHRAAAGPRGQRGEARRDAHVDDLSDDHRRHDLQGAGARPAGPGDRRPPCRPRASAASTAAARRTTASTSISAA